MIRNYKAKERFDNIKYRKCFHEKCFSGLVTKSQLEESDVVIQLPPVVAGPGRGNVPVCLGCLSSVTKVLKNSLLKISVYVRMNHVYHHVHNAPGLCAHQIVKRT